MNKVFLLCYLLLLPGLAITAGCARPTVLAQAPVEPTQTASVSVVKPQRKSVSRIVEQPATVQAFEETQLFARVPGYVGKVQADIGQRIVAGQVLAELAIPEVEEEAIQKAAMVCQAEAEGEQADKALMAAKAQVTVAEAGLTEAEALSERWASEARRMTNLVQSGVLDEQSRDEAINQSRAAAGRLTSAKAMIAKAKADSDRAAADVRAVKARIDVRKADARRQENLLGYGKIRAPYSGVVTGRHVNTGDFVQPTGGKGEWLFSVARIDTVRVVIAVPEIDAPLVVDGSKVTLQVRAAGLTAQVATISRTSWALERSARTLRAEVDLPNSLGKLRPGMYAYATIQCQTALAWTVPVTAVVKQGDAMVCYLIENDKAVRTLVQVGQTDAQSVEILRKSKALAIPVWEEISGNEHIAAKAAGLADGQAVKP